jgi:hypothetical protein
MSGHAYGASEAPGPRVAQGRGAQASQGGPGARKRAAGGRRALAVDRGGGVRCETQKERARAGWRRGGIYI